METKIAVTTWKQMDEIFQKIMDSTLQEDNDEGRREKWRAMYSTMGTASHSDQPRGETIYISCRDISATGLGFFSNKDLDSDDSLLVSLEMDFGIVEIPCKVMHSTATVGGYKVGVKFDLQDAAEDETPDQPQQ